MDALKDDEEEETSQQQLFPLGVWHKTSVSEDGKYRNFVFRKQDTDVVLRYLTGLRPGLKRLNGGRGNAGKNVTKILGKPPKGSIPGWDPRKKCFPPTESVQYWVCQTLNINNKDSCTKVTHIQRGGPGCKIYGTLRVLTEGDACVLSYKLGEDKHTCRHEKQKAVRPVIDAKPSDETQSNKVTEIRAFARQISDRLATAPITNPGDVNILEAELKKLSDIIDTIHRSEGAHLVKDTPSTANDSMTQTPAVEEPTLSKPKSKKSKLSTTLDSDALTT